MFAKSPAIEIWRNMYCWKLVNKVRGHGKRPGAPPEGFRLTLIFILRRRDIGRLLMEPRKTGEHLLSYRSVEKSLLRRRGGDGVLNQLVAAGE